MSVSIHDVARQAKVSITTVSRVLNRSPSVRADTRQRVEEAIRNLHYRPNIFARGLMLKRSNTLGLFLPDAEGEFFSKFVRGASVEAGQRQQQLLVTSFRDEADLSRQIEDLALRGWVDGIILLVPGMQGNLLSALQRTGIRVVLVGVEAKSENVDSVCMDHLGGMRALLDHLAVEHGARRPLFVGGPRETVESADRAAAFQQVLTTNGTRPDPGNVQFLDADIETARGILTERIGRSDFEYDAVLAANDDLAAVTIEAARDAGRSVPENLIVVGFDDSQVALWSRPTLTTVSAPIRQMGAKAVELLIRRVQEPQASAIQLVLPTRLVARGSCGCSPRSPHPALN